jgi:hypothetical protein
MTLDQLEDLITSCKAIGIPGDAIVNVELDDDTVFPDFSDIYIKKFLRYDKEERYDGLKNVIVFGGTPYTDDL